MAHILFGADLSLAVPNGGGHSEDPDANLGSFDITGIVAADNNNNHALQHCTLALGKKYHPAGLVDYLGALPVLEDGVRTPIPSPQSYESGDTVNIPESISTQLTLFYAGTTNAFDNVTANKAQIVMSFGEKNIPMQATTSSFKIPMASSIQPSAPYSPQLQDPMKRMQTEMQEKFITTATNLPPVGERFEVSKDSGAQELAALLVPCQAIVPTALPIARKASLARFLEKRRERVRLMAPYMAKGSAQSIIHQGGAHHSNASPLHKYYNEFWGGPSNAKKLNCSASAFEFGNAVNIEDKNWFMNAAEISMQASECESAT